MLKTYVSFGLAIHWFSNSEFRKQRLFKLKEYPQGVLKIEREPCQKKINFFGGDYDDYMALLQLNSFSTTTTKADTANLF